MSAKRDWVGEFGRYLAIFADIVIRVTYWVSGSEKIQKDADVL